MNQKTIKIFTVIDTINCIQLGSYLTYNKALDRKNELNLNNLIINESSI